jgi:hypothetical protein
LLFNQNANPPDRKNKQGGGMEYCAGNSGGNDILFYHNIKISFYIMIIMTLPGSTDLSSYQSSTPPITSLQTPTKRHAVILATNDVNDISLFLNGLTQNILILYDLFESLGYDSYLIQHNPHNSAEKKNFIHRYRTITPKEIIQYPMPIKLLIEIGMSLDSVTRAYLRSVGAKITKLYLGNILNIDIETIQNCPSIFFNHHIVGEIDEIWTSPHYKQHIDYAALLNQTEMVNGHVVPYVWDPCFINYYGNRDSIEWTPSSDWTTTPIVMMDPNISFQKCFFYSLLLVEAFSKAHPEWKGKLHIINGDRINLQANARNVVLPALSMYQQDRIVLYGRKNIHTILTEFRSGCFITHQWNNDFNYMMLELMYCNYPVLHNSQGWSHFGYHYSIDQWKEAVDTLYRALKDHKQNLNIYKSHAANLIWKHSIHNPDIQAEWKTFL